MFANMCGALLLIATSTALMSRGIPDDDTPFTRRHRLMLTLAVANTTGLILITS